MRLQGNAVSALRRVDAMIAGIPHAPLVAPLKNWLVLERVLAIVSVATPLLLVWFDGRHVRDSISAYYSMEENQIFYFFLTVAAMLFISNGVLKEGHWYNVFLGAMLSGVILFDHDDHTVVHGIFAGLFFVGNVLVILFFSRGSFLGRKWSVLNAKTVFAAVVVVVGLLWRPFGAISLFWAEFFSLVAIAVHYLLDAAPRLDYHAETRRR